MPIDDPRYSRAWVWQQAGAPDALRLQTRKIPVPGPNEVLVSNRAIGLNPVDWKVIESGLDAWQPGHVPGVDGFGVVAATGEKVTLPVGTRVAYHQALSKDGSFAEFTCVDARAIILVPDALSDVSAAALPCTGLTAWQAAGKLADGKGRDVLVTGAGGAVGLIAVQRGIELGWRVFATAAPRHHAALKALGLIEAFDYRDEHWMNRLSEALGPRRLHGLIDTVDSVKAREMASMIGYNGHLVYVMYRQEELPTPVFTTAVSVHEVALNNIHAYGTEADWRDWRAMGAELLAKAANGQLRLPDTEVIGFDAIPLALQRLRDRTSQAKFVALL